MSNMVILHAESFHSETLEKTLAFTIAQPGYVRTIRTGHRIRLVFDTRENFHRADNSVAKLLNEIRQNVSSRTVYLTRGVSKGEVPLVCWSDAQMIRRIFPIERASTRPDVHFSLSKPDDQNFRVEVLRIEAWYSVQAPNSMDDALWEDGKAGDLVRSGKGDLNIEGQMGTGALCVRDGNYVHTITNFRRLADYHEAVSKLAVANDIAA